MKILLALTFIGALQAQAPLPSFSGSGGGGGSATTPGGSTTQLQYNNAGAFGGITGATTNGTALTLVAPVLGTPASGTLTNTNGFPVANLAGAGANVLTFLATPSSANLASALTDETGTSLAVFNTSPLLVTPHVTTILDGNGNPFITSSATGSAVNSITITNATTGLVKIAGSGITTDIVLQLAPKGEAEVQFPMAFKTVKLNSLGDFNADAYTSDAGFSLDNNGLSLGGSRHLFWGAANWFDTPDTGLSRISAGLIGVGTGAAGSHAGTIQAATVVIDNSSFTFNGHTCTIVSTVVTCP